MTSETVTGIDLIERGDNATVTARTRHSMMGGLTVVATYEWTTENPHEWVRVRETAAGPNLPATTDETRVPVTDPTLIDTLSIATDGAF